MKNPTAVLGYVILIVLLTAGAASSLSGSNTVTSDDIVDGQVYGADIRNSTITGRKIFNGTLTGADIADNAVKGADVDESTLTLPVSWHPLQFISGSYSCDGGIFPSEAWNAGFQVPRVAKDQTGRVILDGLVKLGYKTELDGCNPQVRLPGVGILPEGYRPTSNQIVPALCDASGTHAGTFRLEILTTGAINSWFNSECPQSMSTEWVSLSGISFFP